ncbi:hypothetical protein SF83666_b59480 (plasmid) [Sinorhizobium fredii CCBAU 83666]|nr:hypothetical protein SF83666_b59480 [Sinorhizobium fredii CCBAU 83666]
MKGRQLAQGPGVINEFADRGRLRAANRDGSGHDGHADTEAAAAFLFEVFLGRIVLRGCVIAMRMVAAGLGMMIIGLNLMIVGVYHVRTGQRPMHRGGGGRQRVSRQ